ncbi:hypothetical protein BDK51DRAFT_32421 [Blyttiomyces helicus]|uniref:Uncharacterized protein n=1 Tax=Blyttiomyces helicus TaxID=388810 RepID=A0A4P9W9J2_9FUNG|nr:hypothetical protein BDK51DRAFT_32421 [Blyttiomyces helicus]|eukprot:RKO87470.1 hypothetical protein BDK51DRAFT_32421 [Blyttiomyces helicus]
MSERACGKTYSGVLHRRKKVNQVWTSSAEREASQPVFAIGRIESRAIIIGEGQKWFWLKASVYVGFWVDRTVSQWVFAIGREVLVELLPPPLQSSNLKLARTSASITKVSPYAHPPSPHVVRSHYCFPGILIFVPTLGGEYQGGGFGGTLASSASKEKGPVGMFKREHDVGFRRIKLPAKVFSRLGAHPARTQKFPKEPTPLGSPMFGGVYKGGALGATLAFRASNEKCPMGVACAKERRRGRPGPTPLRSREAELMMGRVRFVDFGERMVDEEEGKAHVWSQRYGSDCSRAGCTCFAEADIRVPAAPGKDERQGCMHV